MQDLCNGIKAKKKKFIAQGKWSSRGKKLYFLQGIPTYWSTQNCLNIQ